MTGFLAGLTGLRRGSWELVASVLIAFGVFMMMQPWVFALFTWSFVVTLTGTAMFMIVSKFRD
jgi:hypothetical protein